MSFRLTAFLFCASVFLFTLSLGAQEAPYDIALDYQDLNLDGINDLLFDNNSNSIPDLFESSDKKVRIRTMTAFAEFSFKIVDKDYNLGSVSVQEFRTRQFTLRDLIFEQSSFLGISGGNTYNNNQGSQTCIGGVCVGP